MRVLTTIAWNGHNQWTYLLPTDDSSVLQLWLHEGEAEPRKLYSWNLLQNTAYQDFLNYLLQKFHSNSKQMLIDTVRSIIIVQNAFTMAQLREANELPDMQQDSGDGSDRESS